MEESDTGEKASKSKVHHASSSSIELKVSKSPPPTPSGSADPVGSESPRIPRIPRLPRVTRPGDVTAREIEQQERELQRAAAHYESDVSHLDDASMKEIQQYST